MFVEMAEFTIRFNKQVFLYLFKCIESSYSLSFTNINPLELNCFIYGYYSPQGHFLCIRTAFIGMSHTYFFSRSTGGNPELFDTTSEIKCDQKEKRLYYFLK